MRACHIHLSVFGFLAMTNRSGIRTFTKINSKNFVSLILFSILIMHEISRKLFSSKNYVWTRMGVLCWIVFGFHKEIETQHRFSLAYYYCLCFRIPCHHANLLNSNKNVVALQAFKLVFFFCISS